MQSSDSVGVRRTRCRLGASSDAAPLRRERRLSRQLERYGRPAGARRKPWALEYGKLQNGGHHIGRIVALDLDAIFSLSVGRAPIVIKAFELFRVASQRPVRIGRASCRG